MHKRFRVALGGLALLCLPAVGPPASHAVPDWLLGDWTPVEIRESKDNIYPTEEDEPKRWLAGQHLYVLSTSLTLADDRCQGPVVELHHGPWSVPLHETGGVTLENLDLSKQDKLVTYMSFKCAHDLAKSHGKPDFTIKDDRGIPITWYAIIHSHTEIDLPFFGGSYVKFKKASPTT